MISRRTVRFLLGVAWFLDGLLQLKPAMFTASFITQVILPQGQGGPNWVHSLVMWGGRVTIGHIVLWNAVFAIVQIAIGIAFMVNYRLKQTIVASLFWSLIVWIFGEGFGQLFTGTALLLTGAPGAVFVYGLLGIAIWPHEGPDQSRWNLRNCRFAQYALGILWIAGFFMHLQHDYLTPNGLQQAISVTWLKNLMEGNGQIISLCLGLVELVTGFCLIFRVQLRLAVWVSVVLSLLFWWSGQSFGQVFDSVSTDVNSGPLLVLLAIVAYPTIVSGTGQLRMSISLRSLMASLRER
jgi:hypothetical protein